MNWKSFIRVTATELTAFFFRAARTLKHDSFYWLRAEDPLYLLWLLRHKRRFDPPAASSGRSPVFSILTPAYNTRPVWLRELIGSLRRQTFGDWELLLIDDASSDPASIAALSQLAASDTRIRLLRNEANLGIAASTNRGAEHATGDWLLLLDHDDLLYPDALATLHAGMQQQPPADVLYADEDRLSPRGLRYRYHFKPAFSPSLLEMCNYILHPMCIRRSSWQAAGGMRPECDGSQDYDLLLRLWDRGAKIRHVPGVLYTWRESSESMAGNAFKPHIFVAGKRALREHLTRRGEAFAAIIDNPETELGDYRIQWQISAHTRVLLISDSPPAWSPVWQLTHLTAGPALWRKVQTAASNDYDAVVLLEHGVQIDDQSSIEELIGWCLRADVGVVGGRILDQRGYILHAGLSLAPDATLRADFHARPLAHYSVARRLRDCLAVHGALALAGFKLNTLAAQCNGADNWSLALCLAAHARGWRVVYTPFASFQAEHWDDTCQNSASIRQLLTAHGIYQDPFSNPYLTSVRRNDLRLPLLT